MLFDLSELLGVPTFSQNGPHSSKTYSTLYYTEEVTQKRLGYLGSLFQIVQSWLHETSSQGAWHSKVVHHPTPRGER